MDRLKKVVECRYLETVESLDDLVDIQSDIDNLISIDCNLSEVLGTFLYNGFKQSEVIKALQYHGLQVDYKLFKLSILYVKDMDMYYAIDDSM